MIYILLGNDEFLIKEKLKELLSNIQQANEINIDYINGEKITYQQLLSQLSNLSLFNEKKISFVENFFSNFNKTKKAKDIDDFYLQLKIKIKH